MTFRALREFDIFLREFDTFFDGVCDVRDTAGDVSTGLTRAYVVEP